MSVESVVNQALDQIGYGRHIGSIMEGTLPARVALDLWAQTRDSLLNKLEPNWARRDAKLVVFKQAPNISGGTAEYDVLTPWSDTYPPLPWLYEYAVPTDCIKPLQIKTQVLFLPIWRPRAQLYRYVITDVGESILANTPDAILTYIYKVLNPDSWYDDFRDMMIQLLAQKMQAEFAKGQPMKAEEDGNPA